MLRNKATAETHLLDVARSQRSVKLPRRDVISENELQGINVVSGPTVPSQLAERRRDGSWFLL